MKRYENFEIRKRYENKDFLIVKKAGGGNQGQGGGIGMQGMGEKEREILMTLQVGYRSCRWAMPMRMLEENRWLKVFRYPGLAVEMEKV